ncbi:MAG: cupin-like domain-containing protein [Sphingomonas sp.]|jgi:hypothetical protein|uniref:cupin-like domain-containing protein n=1 Tax=Sphingomonas sp. TaxID=28214 RepID=UPI0035648DE4
MSGTGSNGITQEVPSRDIADLDAARFHEEIVAAATPVILRGLVADWPVTTVAREGIGPLATYLKRLDRGSPITLKVKPRTGPGRFIYDHDLKTFDFSTAEMTVSAVLDRLLLAAAQDDGDYLAAQGGMAEQSMPGFTAANPMPLVSESVAARLWLGNAAIVPAHHDSMDNIACVVAGRRRFTLFPPDQVANLYLSPYRTTANSAVSVVDFDQPDLARYPRFADAMVTALIADLGPGDALYLPALWFHHVRSIERVNMMINYWWRAPAAHHLPAIPALFHAMLAIKHLPEPQRDAWRALFDHFAFAKGGPPGMHLPPEQRGIQGEVSAEILRGYADVITRSLEQPALPREERREGLAARLLGRLGVRRH